MATSKIYPPGTLTLHLTTARIQLALNCASFLTALAPFDRNGNLFLILLLAVFFAVHRTALAKRAKDQKDLKARADEDEEVKFFRQVSETGDGLRGEAEVRLLGGDEAGRAGLPVMEGALDETRSIVAGLVVGLVTIAVILRRAYVMWRDW